MEPERECALGGTNKIVLLRDYRAACIRRVLSSARELLQEKIPFLSSLTFSLLLSSSLFLRPHSFRSFPVDFSTSESSRLLVTQKTKASSTVISSIVTKPRVLFFIRASYLRQEQRRENDEYSFSSENGVVRFYFMSERRDRNLVCVRQPNSIRMFLMLYNVLISSRRCTRPLTVYQMCFAILQSRSIFYNQVRFKSWLRENSLPIYRFLRYKKLPVFICRHIKNLGRSALKIFYCAILLYPRFCFHMSSRTSLVFRKFTPYSKNPRYVHSEYYSSFSFFFFFFATRGYSGF